MTTQLLLINITIIIINHAAAPYAVFPSLRLLLSSEVRTERSWVTVVKCWPSTGRVWSCTGRTGHCNTGAAKYCEAFARKSCRNSPCVFVRLSACNKLENSWADLHKTCCGGNVHWSRERVVAEKYRPLASSCPSVWPSYRICHWFPWKILILRNFAKKILIVRTFAKKFWYCVLLRKILILRIFAERFWYCALLRKVCRDIPNLVEIGQNVRDIWHGDQSTFY